MSKETRYTTRAVATNSASKAATTLCPLAVFVVGENHGTSVRTLTLTLTSVNLSSTLPCFPREANRRQMHHPRRPLLVVVVVTFIRSKATGHTTSTDPSRLLLLLIISLRLPIVSVGAYRCVAHCIGRGLPSVEYQMILRPTIMVRPWLSCSTVYSIPSWLWDVDGGVGTVESAVGAGRVQSIVLMRSSSFGGTRPLGM